jgi:hypothetical protein
MRQIRLSGREASVVRALGFTLSITGHELVEKTSLLPEDLADVLTGLMDGGFVEMTPFAERADPETLESSSFQVNSGYVHELKAALGHMRR